MDTNCVPLLLVDLFLFCYEKVFRLSLSQENQTSITEANSSAYRYLVDLLNIENDNLEQMVDAIYAKEPQLNKTITSETEAPFFWI